MRWFAQQAASMCTSISVVVLKPNQCVELGALDGRQCSTALCTLAAVLGIVVDKHTVKLNGFMHCSCQMRCDCYSIM